MMLDGVTFSFQNSSVSQCSTPDEGAAIRFSGNVQAVIDGVDFFDNEAHIGGALSFFRVSFFLFLSWL